jgi:transcriptional regulator with XRE-family HTH domain
MSLGRRIKERRKTLGLTQQQLAESLGVTPQHISVIEQDKRTPSLSSLARMAEQLGVTVDFLVVGNEGTVTSVITAIKADKRLNLKTKKALIALVEEFYRISPAQ